MACREHVITRETVSIRNAVYVDRSVRAETDPFADATRGCLDAFDRRYADDSHLLRGGAADGLGQV